ncbi:LuxR C-terminal-related transcriptional regulator [Tropicimonas sediminicola]|uniref:Regulatory protein, luxR family n=1 Tax=Tropicimonas sediminicola TaxID=1031541 RepID=A0A239JXN7_9RHOB|nr:LuxR C-terminal-related transcriptional regulator [Tropicimonas sediminicola]SNT10585.1 regulatory protein, luxR family [Tropicimonas sediminicola]
MTDSSNTDGELDSIESTLRELTTQLRKVDAKVDRLLGLYDALGSIAAGVPPRMVSALHAMTPAEHVALQMVLDNRSNHEIAVCLEVDEAEVKAWVDSMLRKLEVGQRRDLRQLMTPVLAKIPAAEYEKASGGIPKDWNDKYGVGGIPDPFRRIYRPE